MSHAFLIESIVACALTVNALRPVPWTAVQVPSFFCSWLCMELAPHNLVIQAGLTTWFAGFGGLHGWQGWTALGLSIASMGGLAWMIVQSHRVRGIVERALSDALGTDYVSKVAPHRDTDYDLRVPWRQLLLPFHMTHPEVERIKDIPYGEIRRRNLLDVYRPKSRPTGAPVLLQIHGGGWVISNKNQQGKPIMLHFASRGWVCFAPNYRLSPRATWPDHAVDIKRAIAWIKEHGEEYGADPSFIVITGGSAGGHLTALAALTPNHPEFQPGFEDADTSVQAAIPYYGVYDFTNSLDLRAARPRTRFLERTVMKRRLSKHREDFEKASPYFQAHHEAPPFFVIHGHHDSLVPVEETRRFVERLREVSSQPVAYAELPGAQHAFDVFPSIRTAHVIRGVERFADYVYATRRAEVAPGEPAAAEA